MEEPFFFDYKGIRLFAISHRPEVPGANIGIIFCHPYGEQKQLSYPVFVRFARELARNGFSVLRFDHRGYGDSQGDVEDSTVETQVEETLAALQLCKERLRVERVALLGLRFGGTVAALAAERDSSIAGLILWFPVISGSQYMDELIRKKLFAELLRKGGGRSREQVLEDLTREGHLAIEGNFLTLQMSEQISAINLHAQIRHFRHPVSLTVMKNPRKSYIEHEALARAYEAQGAPCLYTVVEEQPFWEKDCMYRQQFPERLFEQTHQWVERL